MSKSLFISHAHGTPKADFVKQVFENILGEGIIDRVDEVTRKDAKGYDFKMFFIHFKASSPRLEDAYSRIDSEGSICIFNGDVDRRSGEKRYWKVTHYVKKDKPTPPPTTPYMMSIEEAAEARTRKNGM